jgi:TRAP transporter TAXI family solute receptor
MSGHNGCLVPRVRGNFFASHGVLAIGGVLDENPVFNQAFAMKKLSIRSVQAWLVTLALCCHSIASHSATASDAIATGPETGTYMRIGLDLAKHVASSQGIALQVLPSKGSIENVQRLRHEPGVRLALVQSDVYRAYTDLMLSGNAAAGQLIRPLRVVLPLYDEEIHVVVRADSSLKNLRDIRGKRVNIGPIGSGTAMTAMTLYQTLFGESIPEELISTDTHEVALGKLANDNGAEVVFVVSGQPVGLFVDMKPSPEQHFKLLKLDTTNPIEKKALSVYQSTLLEQKNYPSWLPEDLPALSTKTLLVTFDYNTPSTRQMLTRLVQGLCVNFPVLQAQGHPKWNHVKLGLPPLGQGWQYYSPTAAVLGQCSVGKPKPARAERCSRQNEIMGFCVRQ